MRLDTGFRRYDGKTPNDSLNVFWFQDTNLR